MERLERAAAVGRNVRTLRVARGWSVRDLAATLEVSAATISSIENGKTGVSVERLAQLADTFSVTATSLLITPRATAVPSSSTQNWRSFDPLDLDPALQAAISAFVEFGYHGSSMRAIAEHAGMSQAGVYHYHPSKQSLLIAVFDLTMDEIDWRLDAAISDVDRAPQRLHRLVEALALYHTNRPDLAFIGASEMRSVVGAERVRIAARRSRIQHLIDVEILDALAHDGAACPHPVETGRAIATMCTSLPQWFDPDGPTRPDEIAEQYADLALQMIGAGQIGSGREA